MSDIQLTESVGERAQRLARQAVYQFGDPLLGERPCLSSIHGFEETSFSGHHGSPRRSCPAQSRRQPLLPRQPVELGRSVASSAFASSTKKSGPSLSCLRPGDRMIDDRASEAGREDGPHPECVSTCAMSE